MTIKHALEYACGVLGFIAMFFIIGYVLTVLAFL
jgi:hypothetical protein